MTKAEVARRRKLREQLLVAVLPVALDATWKNAKGGATFAAIAESAAALADRTVNAQMHRL